MKKILLGIVCIIISLLSFSENVFATTASFMSKDGRVFCETDSFDGSYRICTKEESTGTGLSNAERYNSRLVDTTVGQICVEDGKEIDRGMCQEEADATKVIPITTPPIATSTGTVTGTTSTTPVEAAPVVVAPVQKPVAPVANTIPAKEAPIVDSGILQSIKTSYTVCIQSTGNITCTQALLKIKDAFMEMSIASIIGILIALLICIIFWFKMLMHAFGHPISGKLLWIVVILVLSLPGAIVYYIIALRSYEAMILASLPPKPPSFFN